MTLNPHVLLALDTNVLVDWLRQNDHGKRLLTKYHLDSIADRPLYSTIVEGELRALARCWKWGDKKLESLDSVLAELVRVDAGEPDIVRAYAELYEADRVGGHNTGQNDLWIAATCKATGATLLTRDRDCVWMHPKLIAVEFVPPL